MQFNVVGHIEQMRLSSTTRAFLFLFFALAFMTLFLELIAAAAAAADVAVWVWAGKTRTDEQVATIEHVIHTHSLPSAYTCRMHALWCADMAS